MLGREELASAFLATLLDQRKDVRDAFFDMLAGCLSRELADSLKAKTWRVRVEKEQVDIRLDADSEDPAWVVLIENKIQAGSKQPKQLLRYYKKQIETDVDSRVVAVYLAPSAMGESEVNAVKSSALRDCDFAVRLSWNEVAERLQPFGVADPDGFINSGLREINRAIENAAKQKYPNEGEREQIHESVCEVRDRLQEAFPLITISSPWPSNNSFTLATYGTNLTLWFNLIFDADQTPPYLPVNLYDGDKMCVCVQSMIKLSAEGNRNPELKSRWRAILHDEALDVPGLGIHNLKGRWLVFARRFSATPDLLIHELTDIGSLLLHVVESWQIASRSVSAQ